MRAIFIRLRAQIIKELLCLLRDPKSRSIIIGPPLIQLLLFSFAITLEVKNQARVHTWYEAYFGAPYSPLQNAIGGIDRFLVDGTCVGLQADSDGLTLYAPDGLAGLMDGVLRPNRRSPDPRLYAAKARNYQRRWPWLTVLDTVSEEPARPIFMHQIGF